MKRKKDSELRNQNRTDTDDSAENFAARIRWCAKKVGNAKLLAAASGIPTSTMSSYVNGITSPPREFMIAIAKAADVDIAWFLTGDGEPERKPTQQFMAMASGRASKVVAADGEDDIHDSSSVAVPLVSLSASAGHGNAVVSEQVEDYVRFSAKLLRGLGVQPNEIFLMPAMGDSMEPHIRSGELMLCSRAPQHLKGADGTYVARLEGDILVKRIQRLPGGKVVVSSQNPSYSPFEVKLDDGVDFAIIGLVMWVLRRV